MAMKRAANSALRALSSSSSSSSSILTRDFNAAAGSKKIVGVFYKANEYASLNPNFVGCVEGALGIREWLESQGHQYIVTDDKDGPNCGLFDGEALLGIIEGPAPFSSFFFTDFSICVRLSLFPRDSDRRNWGGIFSSGVWEFWTQRNKLVLSMVRVLSPRLRAWSPSFLWAFRTPRELVQPRGEHNQLMRSV